VSLLEPYSWCAWKNQSSGYYYAVGSFGWHKTILLHRLITFADRGQVVGHINGDTLDNRRANLRLCSNNENRLNSRSHRRNNGTSKVKGVSRCGSKWRARIIANTVSYSLGTYNTEVEAALVWNEAARLLHGEFARLNLVNP